MIQSFDLLDLIIELTAPSQDAPAEAIASMTVRCEALGLHHVAGLLTDPLAKDEHADLRWYLEEYPLWPYAEFAERGKHIEARLATIGKRLYQAVFGGILDLMQSWQLQSARQRQISIVSTVPAALSLPWELLHDERGYLVLRTRQPIALLRRLAQRNLGELITSFVPPLHVLLVTARPSGTGFIDPRSLARELLDAVQPQIEAGMITVEFLRPPTRAALRTRLRDTKHQVHLLHFDGHGVFAGEIDPHDTHHKRGGGQGMLAFEREDHTLDLVSAEELGQLLLDSGVKLAVLDACQSAMSAAEDAFSSVAARLIQSGVDAVIAMSASVLVTTATRFFATFYHELAAGTPAPIAQERARQVLYDDPRRHLSQRDPDEEGQPVSLRDWWLPHYYQQRPLTLRANKTPRRRTPRAETPVRFNEAMPPEPYYVFTGRAWELLQIERALLKKQIVVLSGFGGVGKTALVCESADWLTRTGLYTSACFVSFEHGGDAAMLLSELGTFLSINDGAYTPNDPEAALLRLTPALMRRPTLLIADNLESLLPGGDAPLTQETRRQLWQVLRDLAHLGAGVLLTSRDPLHEEALLAPDAHITHLPLGGLRPDDAYTLATHLLEALSITRTRAPYSALRDLLAALDHHPLAIQLVLPSLREQSLTTIRTAFAELLPAFTDATTTGRNRSLLASLDYSLRRLSPEQRAFLPRLAIFEGGASEASLLEITQIPEAQWASLRLALERAALLTPEPVAGWSTPFLRFHPVLTPYLRSQPNSIDLALRVEAASRHLLMAYELREMDSQDPQNVRALIRKELPNLRQTLTFLLADGQMSLAMILANNIEYFLGLFGRWRERSEVIQFLATAPATHAATTPDALTEATYLQEMSLGEEENRRGDLQAATARFVHMLTRIEAQPASTPYGQGSYEHAATLLRLADCQTNLTTATEHLRQALAIIDALLQQDPENITRLELRSVLLQNLANGLEKRGQYSQAREIYEAVQALYMRLGHQHGMAVIEVQLGNLALGQRDYAEASTRFHAALSIFQTMDEPAIEATTWYSLGRVAQGLDQWSEAERCYRACLIIGERLGDTAGTASTCSQLGIVAEHSARHDEAEGWYRRSLKLGEQAHPGSPNPVHLQNLADLLVNEVEAGRAAQTRLTEAKSLAEQALDILEAREEGEIWVTLGTLARIATLEGQEEKAHLYHRRENETFATFPGNRSLFNQLWGPLIADLAAAAHGESVARQKVEEGLSIFKEIDFQITRAIHRLWAGERDWHALVDGLNRVSALLILLVLETIATPATEVKQPRTPKAIIASLPISVQHALGDQAEFAQALKALDPVEQQRVLTALQTLQALREGAS